MRRRPAALAAAVALALPLAGACLPPATPPAGGPDVPVAVRIRPIGAPVATGTLVRIDGDSVAWRGADGEARALPLAAVARVEVADRLNQRDALRRGLIRGGLVGAALGGALLAVRPDAAGGAVALTLGSAWVTGVVLGQQASGIHGPVRWRVVHPADR